MVKEEEQLSRSEFFITAFKKTLSTAVELTKGVTDNLERITLLSENWQVVWNGELPLEQAKFVFSQGKPFFLYREQDRIRAFSGLCPADSNIVSLQPSNGFICTYCGKSYDPTASNPEYALQEFPVRVDGEKVLLAL